MILTRDAEKTIVRFPPGMLKKLAVTARKQGRSRNTEIIVRLMSTFETTAKGKAA